MATDPEKPVTPRPDGPLKPVVDRAKALLLDPKAEWPRIEAEPATPQGIFTSYVMIFAAIPAVAYALMMILFMPRLPGVFGFSLLAVLAGVVVQYLLGLAGVYVMSLIIDALAPSFGGTKDNLKALKLAAYYPTALWVACAALVIPLLGLLIMLVGFAYSLYLLYVGLPVLMKNPPDRTGPYFVVILLIAIIVFWLINMTVQRVVNGGMFY
jgi:hypothetical protein